MIFLEGDNMQHRFILVGHGKISERYLEAISQIPNAEILGVVGRNTERAKQYADKHNLSVYGNKLKEVAAKAHATAVIICTPNAAHYEGVMEASQLGLHCICEKPLHISPAIQSEMIESCKEQGVKLGVSYMRRFLNHIQYIKELIDLGKMGQIKVMDVILKNYRPKEYYKDTWHGTYSLDGGGPFMQQGSHIIDMAIWFGGGYEEVLYSKMFQMVHDIETEDHGYAVVRYQNGSVGMIEASTATVGIDKAFIEISGTQGSITADYEQILSFNVPGVELPEFEKDTPVFESLINDFIHAIETDAEPFISGESSKTATELIVKVYEKSGEPIKII
jgi:UDP-N-acetyl-2-amino-2-deoxyglucuronate dehydrogenase